MPDPDREAYRPPSAWSARRTRGPRRRRGHAAGHSGQRLEQRRAGGRPFPDGSALLALVDPPAGRSAELARQLADALRDCWWRSGPCSTARSSASTARRARSPRWRRSRSMSARRRGIRCEGAAARGAVRRGLALSLVLPWYQKSCWWRVARPGQRQRARGVHVRRGGDPARRGRRRLPRVGALAPRRSTCPAATAWRSCWPAAGRSCCSSGGVRQARRHGHPVGDLRRDAGRGRADRGRPRVRAMHAPEPPNPVAEEVDWVAPPRRERQRTPDRRPRDASAVTEVLRDRPAWEGEPPDPSRAETHEPPEPSETPTRRQRGRRRSRRSVSGRTRRLSPPQSGADDRM